MPPTADGNWQAEHADQWKDEAYVCNIINYSYPLRHQNSLIRLWIPTGENVGAGCQGNLFLRRVTQGKLLTIEGKEEKALYSSLPVNS